MCVGREKPDIPFNYLTKHVEPILVGRFKRDFILKIRYHIRFCNSENILHIPLPFYGTQINIFSFHSSMISDNHDTNE